MFRTLKDPAWQKSPYNVLSHKRREIVEGDKAGRLYDLIQCGSRQVVEQVIYNSGAHDAHRARMHVS